MVDHGHASAHPPDAELLARRQDGAASPVVLASTHERALEIVPLEALREHAVDVPADPGTITG